MIKQLLVKIVAENKASEAINDIDDAAASAAQRIEGLRENLKTPPIP